MRGPLLTRREYLKLGGSALALGAFSPLEALGAQSGRRIPEEGGIHFVKEARWYKKLEGGKVLCELCPRNCRVGDSERGYCGVRENRGGRYHTLVWGNPCATHADPIEKKPFFHVRPGSLAASSGYWPLSPLLPRGSAPASKRAQHAWPAFFTAA